MSGALWNETVSGIDVAETRTFFYAVSNFKHLMTNQCIDIRPITWTTDSRAVHKNPFVCYLTQNRTCSHFLDNFNVMCIQTLAVIYCWFCF